MKSDHWDQDQGLQESPINNILCNHIFWEISIGENIGYTIAPNLHIPSKEKWHNSWIMVFLLKNTPPPLFIIKTVRSYHNFQVIKWTAISVANRMICYSCGTLTWQTECLCRVWPGLWQIPRPTVLLSPPVSAYCHYSLLKSIH